MLQGYGARQYATLGIVLQKALLICGLACLPITALWQYTEPILLRLKQHPDIAAGSASYLTTLTPSLYAMVLQECLKRYLMAQGVVKPAMVITVLTTCIAPGACWLLIFKWGMGLQGAAWALNFLQAMQALLLVVYTVVRDVHLRGSLMQTFHGWSIEAAQGWGRYLKYALPAAAMICMEWWVYEVVIIMAGLLPDADVEVGVMGLLFQILAWVFMSASGIGSAVNTRVGNELGAGQGPKASLAFRTAIGMVMMTQSTLAVVVWLLRDQLLRVFTQSESVLAASLHVMPALVLTLITDGNNCVLAGVLRGAGRQSVGAWLNFVGYWLVGLPLALLLGFRMQMGALGFWLALLGASFLQNVLQLAFIFSLDWHKEASRAQQEALQEAEQLPVVGDDDVQGDADDAITAPLLQS